MKTRHTIYNSVGLAIASIEGIFFVLNLLALLNRHSSTANPLVTAWLIIIELSTVIFVGGGALSNMAANRLKPSPTIAMVIVYCLSCIFLPLGIWGAIELNLSQNAKRQRQHNNQGTKSRHLSFTIGFLQRSATISWMCSIVGFIIVVLCGASHIKPVINISIFIYIFALILSFVLGIVALLGVREHGRKGILIPALIGVCTSGLFIFIFVIALVIGMTEGAKDWRQKHSGTPQSYNQSTNDVASP